MSKRLTVSISRVREATRGARDALFAAAYPELRRLAPDEAGLLQVQEGLQELEKADARIAQVVKMSSLGGPSDAEIAQMLEFAVRTVQRDWDMARALLTPILSPA